MSTTIPEPQSNVLLEAYKRQITEELYKELLADAEPILRKAAAAAADSLEIAMTERVHSLSRGQLFTLEVKFNAEKIK